MNEAIPQYAQLAVWLGIVNQLYDTRMSQLLGKHNFTLTQFALLNHLGRNFNGKHTISALADALEVNQPGVTKIVKKMVALNLVAVEKDPEDSRKKFVSITAEGGAMIMAVQQEIAPDIAAWFAEWDEEDMGQFLSNLQRLGGWLEQNKVQS